MKNKELFIQQFKRIAVDRQKRSLEDVFCTMDELYKDDPREAIKLAFLAVSYARSNCHIEVNGKPVRVEVYGLRGMYEGTGMMYWLVKNKPRIFYSNIIQMGSLFGGWNGIIGLWEFDIRNNDFDLSKCILSQGRIRNILMKMSTNPIYGPELTRALPNIRKASDAKTPHRKARNIIAKNIRSNMPMSKDANQNRYYRALKKSYRHIHVKYMKVDMSWIKSIGIEMAYDRIMNQRSLTFINFKELNRNENKRKPVGHKHGKGDRRHNEKRR